MYLLYPIITTKSHFFTVLTCWTNNWGEFLAQFRFRYTEGYQAALQMELGQGAFGTSSCEFDVA